MFERMPTALPATAVPVSKWNTARQDRRAELQYNQTLNGSAWKSGGYLYNEIRKDAVAALHPSGLFNVYVDPAEQSKESVKPVDVKKSSAEQWASRMKSLNKKSQVSE
jgi:hypothetical protein